MAGHSCNSSKVCTYESDSGFGIDGRLKEYKRIHDRARMTQDQE